MNSEVWAVTGVLTSLQWRVTQMIPLKLSGFQKKLHECLINNFQNNPIHLKLLFFKRSRKFQGCELVCPQKLLNTFLNSNIDSMSVTYFLL